MAPKKQKNMKTSGDSEAFTRPQTITTKSPARTPIQSPRKKTGGITVAQKQALIDNLQLEVTERARKLRAQYALQAQSLRTRIELRVNRIPTAMRKANMGELLEKYMQINDTKTSSTKKQAKELPGPDQHAKPPAAANKPETSDSVDSATGQPRRLKRTSDQISTDGDKENASSAADMALPNPKKRSKATTTARAPVNGNAVLSPKSANSRTMPRRQQQQQEQEKSDILPTKPSRQTSPLKPTISATTTAAAIPLSPAKATAMLTSMLANARAPAQSSGNTNTNTKPKATSRSTKAAAAAPSLTRQPSATTNPRGAAATRNVPQSNLTTDAATVRKASNTSTMSTASAGTTIVKSAPAARGRGGRAAATATAAATKAATTAAAARKVGAVAPAAKGRKAAAGGGGDDAGGAAAAKATVGGVKEGRRVLRKR